MTAEEPAPADRFDDETLEALIEGDKSGELTFEAPWQARAFGIAVALRDQGAVTWTDFQERFIATVEAADPDRMQADVESVYYECWLETVEELLLDGGIIGEDEIDRRTVEFSEGVRDASEFMSR